MGFYPEARGRINPPAARLGTFQPILSNRGKIG